MLREADLTNNDDSFVVEGGPWKQLIDLRPIKTDAQIKADVERIRPLWPEPKDWERRI